MRRAREVAAALVAMVVATLVATGCGANDNGGVMERPTTTTQVPVTRS